MSINKRSISPTQRPVTTTAQFQFGQQSSQKKQHGSSVRNLKSPYQTFYPQSSPRMLNMPLNQEQAQQIIMRELSFITQGTKPTTTQMATIEIKRGQSSSVAQNSIAKIEAKKSRQLPSTKGLYTQAEMLPLVMKEVSALAKQHIKVREPSDFLKIRQRVKNDLEGMNHANAFFRQRYSAHVNQELAMQTSQSPQSRVQTSSNCYRPRPFIDARSNCLANYDEYLIMRDIDKQKQQSLSNHLRDQIQYKRASVLASRQNEQPYSETNGFPVALASGNLVKFSNEQATPLNDNDASADKRRALIERRKEQRMQTDRLKEQLEMNRKIASIRNQDTAARDLEKQYTRSILDANQMNDYHSYVASKLKSKGKQQDLSNVYRQASQRNTKVIQTVESKRSAMNSMNEKTDRLKMNTLTPGSLASIMTANAMHSPPTRPYQDRRDLDIDPNRGYLAHFFRRDADPDNDNVGRQFLHKALDKQKHFDQIFLKHIIAGEREKQERANRKRSTSLHKS